MDGLKSIMKLFVPMLFLAWGIISCNSSSGGNDRIEKSSDARIFSFQMTGDSTKILASTHFSIDQIENKIFNLDSLPYKFDFKEARCVIKSGSGVQILYEDSKMNEPKEWKSKDTLNIEGPIRFYLTSSDKRVKRTYEVMLNIHQVDPNVLKWTKHQTVLPIKKIKDGKALLDEASGKVFAFLFDGKKTQLFHGMLGPNLAWESQALDGFPDKANLSTLQIGKNGLYVQAENALYHSELGTKWNRMSTELEIVSFLGLVPKVKGVPEYILTIIKKDGLLYFASFDGEKWAQGEVVDEKFPIQGFASGAYRSNNKKAAIIFGGKDSNGNLSNKVWGTYEGLRWVTISSSKEGSLPPAAEHSLMVNYEEGFYLFVPIIKDGQTNMLVYKSKDKGISWSIAEEAIQLGEEFKGQYVTILVDKNKYIYLLGKKPAAAGNFWNNDIVYGRINRYGFKR